MGGYAWCERNGLQRGQKQFLHAIKASCNVAKILKEQGVRSYGCIRIDSATSPVEWAKAPEEGTRKIAATFKEAARIAADHGERLAAEGEICWAGMHSWKYMLELLEAVGEPETLGFQADLAHTYLYLLGVNAPEHQLLEPGYDEASFWDAYQSMVKALALGCLTSMWLRATEPYLGAEATTKLVATARPMPQTVR